VKPRILRSEPGREYLAHERCHILELSNSDEDEDVSLARARVSPGVTTLLHRLGNTVERYLIIEGRGRVEVGGLEPADVGPGDVVLIPRGATQRIANTGASDLVFLCVCTPRFRPEDYEALE
jgi:mannose-6-phosphate isomerase-like protein (cupin superfamily)